MKLYDFIHNVLPRGTNRPDMIRIIYYKIGETFDFFDEVEFYDNYHSEIDEVYIKRIVPDYYQLNVCCTWQDEDRALNIVVEL